MAVAPVVRPAGRGRQPAAVERERDLRDELVAHRAEAVAFVNGVMPLVSRLAYAASYLDPATNQCGRAAVDRLARYRARHVVEAEA